MAYLSTVGIAVKKDHFDKQFTKFKKENKDNEDFKFIVDFIEKGCSTSFAKTPDTNEDIIIKIWKDVRWDSESDYAYNNEKPLPEVQAVIDICSKENNDGLELMRIGDDEYDYEHINSFSYQFFDFKRSIDLLEVY